MIGIPQPPWVTSVIVWLPSLYKKSTTKTNNLYLNSSFLCCLLSCHWALLRRVYPHLLCSPVWSTRYLRIPVRSLRALFSPTWAVPGLTACPYFIIWFFFFFTDLLHFVNFFSTVESSFQHTTPGVPQQCWAERRHHLPGPVGNSVLNAALSSHLLSFVMRTCCWLMVTLIFTSGPSLPSCFPGVWPLAWCIPP